MLKYYGKGEKLQFLHLSTIFCYFYVKSRIRFSLRDKRLFEIMEVKITRVDYIKIELPCKQTKNIILVLVMVAFIFLIHYTCKEKPCGQVVIATHLWCGRSPEHH